MDSDGAMERQQMDGMQRLFETVQSRNQRLREPAPDLLAGTTRLFGNRDTLRIIDERVGDLLEQSTFADVAWLILSGELPCQLAQADCEALLVESAVADPTLLQLVRSLPLNASPVELFPTLVALQSHFDAGLCDVDEGMFSVRSRVLRLMAQLPAVIGQWVNEREAGFGPDPSSADESTKPAGAQDDELSESPELGYAGRLLTHMRGGPVLPAEERALDALLIAHSVASSTIATACARQSAAADARPNAALVVAAAAFASDSAERDLEKVLSFLQSIRSPGDVSDQWISDTPGDALDIAFSEDFDDTDPRHYLLRDHCRQLLGHQELIVREAIASKIERLMLKQQRFPTLTWVTARLFHYLGLPTDIAALLMGLAKLPAWSAHTMEQQTQPPFVTDWLYVG